MASIVLITDNSRVFIGAFPKFLKKVISAYVILYMISLTLFSPIWDYL